MVESEDPPDRQASAKTQKQYSQESFLQLLHRLQAEKQPLAVVELLRNLAEYMIYSE